jgi:hypothetical protein
MRHVDLHDEPGDDTVRAALATLATALQQAAAQERKAVPA